jgi:hypothetical protein
MAEAERSVCVRAMVSSGRLSALIGAATSYEFEIPGPAVRGVVVPFADLRI